MTQYFWIVRNCSHWLSFVPVKPFWCVTRKYFHSIVTYALFTLCSHDEKSTIRKRHSCFCLTCTVKLFTVISIAWWKVLFIHRLGKISFLYAQNTFNPRPHLKSIVQKQKQKKKGERETDRQRIIIKTNRHTENSVCDVNPTAITYSVTISIRLPSKIKPLDI